MAGLLLGVAACATPEELAAYQEAQADEEAQREMSEERLEAALASGECEYRQQTGFRTRRVLQCEPGVLRPGDPDEAGRSMRDWQDAGALCTSQNQACNPG
ncbi:hypothetical protein DDZ18_10725 [Marinicauda salina]|uniref:Uncharacterized protein n=1 Tax=Marinicauda salina TaxID=2135793 RepID=A0A2U2BRQ5_9PROT|nr:hypothetical protein [Marinicauda salina]PWE16676.1 hypothetical protein DDZ18_10725 [Marinicauda salina]